MNTLFIAALMTAVAVSHCLVLERQRGCPQSSSSVRGTNALTLVVLLLSDFLRLQKETSLFCAVQSLGGSASMLLLLLQLHIGAMSHRSQQKEQESQRLNLNPTSSRLSSVSSSVVRSQEEKKAKGSSAAMGRSG